MPGAVFEGLTLRNVHLGHSDLRGAIFRSAPLQAVLLNDSDLSGAIFDLAHCIRQGDAGFSIALSNSELGLRAIGVERRSASNGGHWQKTV